MNTRLGILGLGLGLLLPLAAATFDIHSPWSRQKTQPDNSQGAVVSQVIGTDTWVQIAYHRPGVKDRNVWKDSNSRGQRLVPWDGDPTPWRAGANEATTIEFSGDVKVEGHELAAGRYALFMMPHDGDWTLILQEDNGERSASRYDADDDALRIDVTPERAPHNEWLAYGFDDAHAWSAKAYMHWETLKVPFRIEVEGQGEEQPAR